MEAAIVLARFSTDDSHEAARREQASEELNIRFQSRTLDLMHKIAPELSINECREAAGNLVRLSKSNRWDAQTTKQAAEQTFQVVTGRKLEIQKAQ